jgi:hypothetical protein
MCDNSIGLAATLQLLREARRQFSREFLESQYAFWITSAGRGSLSGNQVSFTLGGGDWTSVGTWSGNQITGTLTVETMTHEGPVTLTGQFVMRR